MYVYLQRGKDDLFRSSLLMYKDRQPIRGAISLQGYTVITIFYQWE